MLLAGCSKGDVDVYKQGLTSPISSSIITPGTTVNVWQLSAIKVNDVDQTLTTQQSTFKITFNADGRYADSDGVIGNWLIPTSDSLQINQTNLPTPITIRFKIKLRTTTTLALTQTSNNKITDLIYEAK